jgi:uncharacterized protein (UPF0248 family)
MKTINIFLTEKLHLNKNIMDKYKYHPENKSELVNIIVNKINKNKNIDIVDLNDIDTSKINDMTKLFWGVIRIVNINNVDISKWDVSNVKSFNNCFTGFQHFNCDLSSWDVSSCEDFESMFDGCYDFNSDLSKWDFKNALNTKFMFNGCFEFDTDVSSWDLSNVKSINRMFDSCKNFRGIGLNKIKINKSIINDANKRKDTFYNCNKVKKLPEWYE